jgi:nucleotide-binding universal stress UspA family protein
MSKTSARARRLPRKILVAVDAQGSSDHAVICAARMAEQFEAKLAFVHAIGTPLFDVEFAESPRIATTAQGLANQAERAVASHIQGLLAKTGFSSSQAAGMLHVASGRPARIVVEHAQEIGADWIVLGALRQRSRLDFGSTTRAVLHAAPAVWVQPGQPRPIERILVPVDLSERSLAALAHACALAKRWNAHVRAVHCFDSVWSAVSPFSGYPEFTAAVPVDEVRKASGSAFAKAMDEFDWDGVAHETAFFDAPPVEKIVELGRTVDLTVMSTHGRTGLAGAMLGHVAYSVLEQSTHPTLAIRDAQAFTRAD